VAFALLECKHLVGKLVAHIAAGQFLFFHDPAHRPHVIKGVNIGLRLVAEDGFKAVAGQFERAAGAEGAAASALSRVSRLKGSAALRGNRLMERNHMAVLSY